MSASKNEKKSAAERSGGRANADVKTEKQSDLIGQNLRRVYDDVAAEPLPDRFSELLKKLKSEDAQ